MFECLTAQTQTAIKPTFTPITGRVLQRTCACGQHTLAGGECAQCQQKRLAATQWAATGSMSLSTAQLDASLRGFIQSRVGYDFSQVAVQRSGIPAKALGVSPEEQDKEKPSPRQGSASIQCNGSGGYEIVYGGWAGATCGTKDCVTAHESSHMADWQTKWPTGCQGQPKGYLPKGDPPDSPLMTVAQYQAFLKDSECKAHTVDLACAEALPKPAGCEKTVDDYIKLTKEQKANWCPSLSRGAKVAIGLGGGALVGAGIGALAGGPLGAAIGAGVGALAGGIAGLLL